MDGRLMEVFEKKGGYIGHWIFWKGQKCYFIVILCYLFVTLTLTIENKQLGEITFVI